MKNIYNLTVGVMGEYLPYVVRPDGSEYYPLGEEFLKNVITDIGLDKLMVYTYNNSNQSHAPQFMVNRAFCRIGSGNTATATTDTQLVTQIASTSALHTGAGANATDRTNVNTTGAVTHQWTYQFAPVGGATTVNEIGVGWGESGATLLSRFVTPVTLTLLAGEILRVRWRFTISCPQFVTSTDTVGSVIGFDAGGASPSRGLRITGNSTALFGGVSAAGDMDNNVGGFGLIGLLQSGVDGNAWGYLMTAHLASNTVFPAVGTPTTVASLSLNISNFSRTYTGTGSGVSPKYLDRVYEFTPTQPASTVTNVSAFIIQAGGALDYPVTQMVILFDNPQIKANTHRLRFGIRTSLTRL